MMSLALIRRSSSGFKLIWIRPLFMVVDGIRRSLPQNLEEQFTALVREILLTLRALIDWYLERLDRRPAEPQVEDIPID